VTVKQQFKKNKFSIQLQNKPTNTVVNSICFYGTMIENDNNTLTVSINDGFKSNDVLKYFIESNQTV
jgi:ABC-2 type transport system ATP-binding protein